MVVTVTAASRMSANEMGVPENLKMDDEKMFNKKSLQTTTTCVHRKDTENQRQTTTTVDTTANEMINSHDIQPGSAQGSSPRLEGHCFGNKGDMVFSLLSILGTHNQEDMSRTLLAMSTTSYESCVAMRQSGCLPLIIHLLHGGENDASTMTTRTQASAALHNIIHVHCNDQRGRQEARVLRLLEQIRGYCNYLRTPVNHQPLDHLANSNYNGPSDFHPGPAVAALMKLSFDEEHRHAVCTLGGVQAMAELLQMDHEIIGNTTNQYHVTMRRYACMALTNLTFGDGTNKALLCSMVPALKALVLQLESNNEDLCQVAASVLRNLSWHADVTSKRMLRDVGSVSTLTQAMLGAKKESILKSLLSALWNFSSHCTENKADICSTDGALEFLVKNLMYRSFSKTLSIIENCGGILRNVSSHIAVHENYRLILRQNGCIQILLKHLRSPSLTVVSNACGTLWNLSAHSSDDQRLLLELGAINMLKNLVHSKHKMISMGSAAALKNLLTAAPALNGGSLEPILTMGGSKSEAAPGLHMRRQRALQSELEERDLSETCDNMESPQTSPTESPKLEVHGKKQKSQIMTGLMNNASNRRATSSSRGQGHLDPSRGQVHLDPSRGQGHLDPSRGQVHLDPSRGQGHFDPPSSSSVIQSNPSDVATIDKNRVLEILDKSNRLLHHDRQLPSSPATRVGRNVELMSGSDSQFDDVKMMHSFSSYCEPTASTSPETSPVDSKHGMMEAAAAAAVSLEVIGRGRKKTREPLAMQVNLSGAKKAPVSFNPLFLKTKMKPTLENSVQSFQVEKNCPENEHRKTEGEEEEGGGRGRGGEGGGGGGSKDVVVSSKDKKRFVTEENAATDDRRKLQFEADDDVASNNITYKTMSSGQNIIRHQSFEDENRVPYQQVNDSLTVDQTESQINRLTLNICDNVDRNFKTDPDIVCTTHANEQSNFDDVSSRMTCRSFLPKCNNLPKVPRISNADRYKKIPTCNLENSNIDERSSENHLLSNVFLCLDSEGKKLEEISSLPLHSIRNRRVFKSNVNANTVDVANFAISMSEMANMAIVEKDLNEKEIEDDLEMNSVSRRKECAIFEDKSSFPPDLIVDHLPQNNDDDDDDDEDAGCCHQKKPSYSRTRDVHSSFGMSLHGAFEAQELSSPLTSPSSLKGNDFHNVGEMTAINDSNTNMKRLSVLSENDDSTSFIDVDPLSPDLDIAFIDLNADVVDDSVSIDGVKISDDSVHRQNNDFKQTVDEDVACNDEQNLKVHSVTFPKHLFVHEHEFRMSISASIQSNNTASFDLMNESFPDMGSSSLCLSDNMATSHENVEELIDDESSVAVVVYSSCSVGADSSSEMEIAPLPISKSNHTTGNDDDHEENECDDKEMDRVAEELALEENAKLILSELERTTMLESESSETRLLEYETISLVSNDQDSDDDDDDDDNNDKGDDDNISEVSCSLSIASRTASVESSERSSSVHSRNAPVVNVTRPVGPRIVKPIVRGEGSKEVEGPQKTVVTEGGARGIRGRRKALYSNKTKKTTNANSDLTSKKTTTTIVQTQKTSTNASTAYNNKKPANPVGLALKSTKPIVPKRTVSGNKTKAPLPSLTKAPLPSLTKAPLPSLTKAPLPSSTKAPLPSSADKPPFNTSRFSYSHSPSSVPSSVKPRPPSAPSERKTTETNRLTKSAPPVRSKVTPDPVRSKVTPDRAESAARKPPFVVTPMNAKTQIKSNETSGNDHRPDSVSCGNKTMTDDRPKPPIKEDTFVKDAPTSFGVPVDEDDDDDDGKEEKKSDVLSLNSQHSAGRQSGSSAGSRTSCSTVRRQSPSVNPSGLRRPSSLPGGKQAVQNQPERGQTKKFDSISGPPKAVSKVSRIGVGSNTQGLERNNLSAPTKRSVNSGGISNRDGSNIGGTTKNIKNSSIPQRSASGGRISTFSYSTTTATRSNNVAREINLPEAFTSNDTCVAPTTSTGNNTRNTYKRTTRNLNDQIANSDNKPVVVHASLLTRSSTYDKLTEDYNRPQSTEEDDPLITDGSHDEPTSESLSKKDKTEKKLKKSAAHLRRITRVVESGIVVNTTESTQKNELLTNSTEDVGNKSEVEIKDESTELVASREITTNKFHTILCEKNDAQESVQSIRRDEEKKMIKNSFEMEDSRDSSSAEKEKRTTATSKHEPSRSSSSSLPRSLLLQNRLQMNTNTLPRSSNLNGGEDAPQHDDPKVKGRKEGHRRLGFGLWKRNHVVGGAKEETQSDDDVIKPESPVRRVFGWLRRSHNSKRKTATSKSPAPDGGSGTNELDNGGKMADVNSNQTQNRGTILRRIRILSSDRNGGGGISQSNDGSSLVRAAIVKPFNYERPAEQQQQPDAAVDRRKQAEQPVTKTEMLLARRRQSRVMMTSSCRGSMTSEMSIASQQQQFNEASVESKDEKSTFLVTSV